MSNNHGKDRRLPGPCPHFREQDLMITINILALEAVVTDKYFHDPVPSLCLRS